MRRLPPLSRLAALAALVLGVATALAEPVPFDARYSVRLNGFKLGHMTRTLRVDADGLYSMVSRSQASGVASLLRSERIEEETRWREADGQIIPAAYRYQQVGGRKPRTVAVTFDWQAGSIENTYNGRTWRMAALPGVLDKLLYQVALMRDLATGKRKFEYAVADGGHIKTYRLEATGEERVTNQLGVFDTVRIVRRRSDKQRETTIWSAPKLNYLPVRVDSRDGDGAVTSVTLERLTGLPQR